MFFENDWLVYILLPVQWQFLISNYYFLQKLNLPSLLKVACAYMVCSYKKTLDEKFSQVIWVHNGSNSLEYQLLIFTFSLLIDLTSIFLIRTVNDRKDFVSTDCSQQFWEQIWLKITTKINFIYFANLYFIEFKTMFFYKKSYDKSIWKCYWVEKIQMQTKSSHYFMRNKT